MKRVVTMQDISCLGKCSSTIAHPILSAMGFDTCLLPTAILSSPTSFHHFSFLDLSDHLPRILEAWQNERIRFDGIYTGYLGNLKQVNIALDLFDRFGSDTIKLVDPCMGDHGKLYAGFSKAFVTHMFRLCQKADIICPNLTEAYALLQEDYIDLPSKAQIEDILVRLSQKTAPLVILTGVKLNKDAIGIYAYDQKSHRFFHYETPFIHHYLHGTGDLWASLFYGYLMQDIPYELASQKACDMVKLAIERTLNDPHRDVKNGVAFEWIIQDICQK